eukprot:2056957-Ditylum_brightwellii.AAC.1
MFRAGKAHELLDNAYNAKSLTPGEKSAKALANPIPPDAATQGAADAGSSKGALKLILQSAPPALYNNDLYDTVLDLYPQQGAGGMSPE